MLNKLFAMWKILNNDLAIDMGSANTLISTKGKDGVQLNEPSIVAIQNDEGKKTVVAVGADAKKLMGRTSTDITADSPLSAGIIIKDSIAEIMMKNFINKVSDTDILRPSPRVFLSVPSSATEVERRIFKEVLADAGARNVFLIESPMAAALGAGLPIESEKASMIVNIGAGITEIGVISLKKIIKAKTLKIGGNDLDEAIMGYIRRVDAIKIGAESAEKIKKTLATAIEEEALEENSMNVRGQLVQSGLPVKFEINQKEVLISLAETYEQILAGIISLIESLPTQVATDLYENGIHLCGGTSNINGIDKLIERFTGLKVTLVPEPTLCVIRGLKVAMDMYNTKGAQ